jgi:hypothetical protein
MMFGALGRAVQIRTLLSPEIVTIRAPSGLNVALCTLSGWRKGEPSSSPVATSQTLRQAKYKDAGLLALDIQEIYILDGDLCQKITKTVLSIRNIGI